MLQTKCFFCIVFPYFTWKFCSICLLRCLFACCFPLPPKTLKHIINFVQKNSNVPCFVCAIILRFQIIRFRETFSIKWCKLYEVDKSFSLKSHPPSVCPSEIDFLEKSSIIFLLHLLPLWKRKWLLAWFNMIFSMFNGLATRLILPNTHTTYYVSEMREKT